MNKLLNRLTVVAATMAAVVLATGLSAPRQAAAGIPTDYVNYLRVLDTNNCLAHNGTKVFVAKCGSAGTKWLFGQVSNGDFRLKVEDGFDCLEAGHNSIYLETCDTRRPAQRWMIIGHGSQNWATISNYDNNRYINYDHAGGVFMTSGQGVELTEWEWVPANGLEVRGPQRAQASVVGTTVSPVQHAVVAGRAAYTWSTRGLPPGLSIDAETGTISGTPTTAGSFTVEVTATEHRNLPRSGSTSYRWTVLPVPAPGCSGTTGADVAIPDHRAYMPAESYTAIGGCTGSVSAATVEVHIKHPDIGNLMVWLVTPSGRGYLLHNRTGSWDQDIDKTYVKELSAPEVADGVWRLQVNDEVADGNSGLIDSWTIKL